MARREDMKRIRARFGDVLQHKILNDVVAAVRGELLERAHMEVPGPAGKVDTGKVLAMKVLFQGELSERDQGAARGVMQSLKNPASLLFLLRKHGGA